MRARVPALPPGLALLAVVACGPDPVASDSASTGTDASASETDASATLNDPSGGAETDTSDTSASAEGPETTTQTGTETGGDPPGWPALEGDNCKVEVLWSRVSPEGLRGDTFDVLEPTGSGAFVLGGLAYVDDYEYATMLLGVVDGETAWVEVDEEVMWSFDGEQPIVAVEARGDGSFMVLRNTLANGIMSEYSAAGEALSNEYQYGTNWYDLAPIPGGYWAVGIGAIAMNELETKLGAFDEFGVLSAEAWAPTVGITQADVDWATEIFVEDDRVWVAGWDDDRCGVLIEYDPLGVEQWWGCMVLGEDGEGRLTGLEPLPNGNLAMIGSARITKNGYWYHEPWIAAVTREGEAVWEWRPSGVSTLGGPLEDLAVMAGGDILAVYGEKNLGTGGIEANRYPVIMRRTQDNEYVERCALSRPGIGDEWRAELVQVVLGQAEEIYVLLDERVGALGDHTFSIVEISGLE